MNGRDLIAASEDIPLHQPELRTNDPGGPLEHDFDDEATRLAQATGQDRGPSRQREATCVTWPPAWRISRGWGRRTRFSSWSESAFTALVTLLLVGIVLFAPKPRLSSFIMVLTLASTRSCGDHSSEDAARALGRWLWLYP